MDLGISTQFQPLEFHLDKDDMHKSWSPLGAVAVARFPVKAPATGRAKTLSLSLSLFLSLSVSFSLSLSLSFSPLLFYHLLVQGARAGPTTY